MPGPSSVTAAPCQSPDAGLLNGRFHKRPFCQSFSVAVAVFFAPRWETRDSEPPPFCLDLISEAPRDPVSQPLHSQECVPELLCQHRGQVPGDRGKVFQGRAARGSPLLPARGELPAPGSASSMELICMYSRSPLLSPCAVDCETPIPKTTWLLFSGPLLTVLLLIIRRDLSLAPYSSCLSLVPFSPLPCSVTVGGPKQACAPCPGCVPHLKACHHSRGLTTPTPVSQSLSAPWL